MITLLLLLRLKRYLIQIGKSSTSQARRFPFVAARLKLSISTRLDPFWSYFEASGPAELLLQLNQERKKSRFFVFLKFTIDKLVEVFFVVN
jgi:hypothetical protein